VDVEPLVVRLVHAADAEIASVEHARRPDDAVACFAVSLLARLFRHGRLDLRMAWIREASEKQLPGRLVIECGV